MLCPRIVQYLERTPDQFLAVVHCASLQVLQTVTINDNTNAILFKDPNLQRQV